MGLKHSKKDWSIMYGTYKDSNAALTDDDINGIQALYGPPKGFRPPIEGKISIFA